jgi:steroid 5-alpha reductase family enzyme
MLSLPILGLALVLMALAMNAAWAFQRRVGNSGWIDVFWTFGTGVAGVLAALFPFAGAAAPSARQMLAAGIILIWALRLGGYIARRVATSDEDARYARFRKIWGEGYQRTLYLFVMPQAAISALLCASIMIAAHRPLAGLDARDLAAAAILLIAIAGEGLADAQMAAFKKSAPPKGSVCDRGLWAWSRHPNYFFEWTLWLAWPVMGLDPARPVTWLTLIAPVAMFGVLRFLTGVPPLEETMIASRGDAYRAYQARTSAFFPLPPRHGA